MRRLNIMTIAIAAAASFAFAATPADAGRVHVKKRGVPWNVGVIDAGGGFFYGPHYGYPSHPSYWATPTRGVYAVDPYVCQAPRAYPGWFGSWSWGMEPIC